MAHKKFIENPLGVWLSKKQSLLIPLQELKRRIPACSLSDLSGSVIQGYTRKSSPALRGERCHMASLPRGEQTAWEVLICYGEPWVCSASTMGREGKEVLGSWGRRNFPPAELIYAAIYFPICHLQAGLNLSSTEQRSCSGWGWDETRVAVEWIAWILPSLAPCGAADSPSITSLLSFSPNEELQKMFICLSN